MTSPFDWFEEPPRKPSAWEEELAQRVIRACDDGRRRALEEALRRGGRPDPFAFMHRNDDGT